MSAEIHRVTRSPRKRCAETFAISGYVLRCKERAGHDGMHFADVKINGIACETGWRDGDEGASSGTTEAAQPLTPEFGTSPSEKAEQTKPAGGGTDG